MFWNQGKSLFLLAFFPVVTSVEGCEPARRRSAAFLQLHQPRRCTVRLSNRLRPRMGPQVVGKQPFVYTKRFGRNSEDPNDDDAATDDGSDSIQLRHRPDDRPFVRRLSRTIGGRRRRRGTNNRRQEAELESNGGPLNKERRWWPTLAVLILPLVLLLSQLGGPSSSPSFVYYQSSVLETTTVRPDGTTERARKESFKSNLPDLVRQQRQLDDDDSRKIPTLLSEPDFFSSELDEMLETQDKLLDDFLTQF